jgi:hypothetical protein
MTQKRSLPTRGTNEQTRAHHVFNQQAAQRQSLWKNNCPCPQERFPGASFTNYPQILEKRLRSSPKF